MTIAETMSLMKRFQKFISKEEVQNKPIQAKYDDVRTPSSYTESPNFPLDNDYFKTLIGQDYRSDILKGLCIGLIIAGFIGIITNIVRYMTGQPDNYLIQILIIIGLFVVGIIIWIVRHLLPNERRELIKDIKAFYQKYPKRIKRR